MPITTDDVQRMATLARLDIPQETPELFARQFVDILTYMDVLATVDTKDTEPLYSPSLHATPLRQDAADNRRQREDVLSNAPQQDGQYFVVPRIV